MDRQEQKRAVFNKLVSTHYKVGIVVDNTRQGVQLPPHLRGRNDVLLDIGMNLEQPILDLRSTPEYLAGILSFGGKPFSCIFPWSTIYAFQVEEGMVAFHEDAPASIMAQVKQEDVFETRAKSAPASAPEEPRGNVISFADARRRLRGESKGSPFPPKKGA